METNREILADAAKNLLRSGIDKAEIIESLKLMGVSDADAQAILDKVRGEKTTSVQEVSWERGNKQSFWDTSGEDFFGRKATAKTGKPGENRGLLKGVLKRVSKEEKKGSPEMQREEGPEGFKKAPVTAATPFRKTTFREILPARVSDFDKLIERGGFKRGDTIMISGGCGTGKTTFCMQSLYHGALHGENGVYLTLEESADKMRENMMQNFGWDLDGLEREGKMAIIKIDPLTIARAVEAILTKERGGLYIEFEEFELPFQFDLPFKPDRVAVDSLSALSIAFMENEQAYRMYLRHLFSTLEQYNSVNYVLGETEQEPGIYSRSGIEEFLADGVVVFYNIKIHNSREKAMEILKLRTSNHEKRIVPYKIGPNGMEIYINEELFREEF